MTGFCVYRYIEKNTNEIVYIGKTKQLFVTNRLEQHKNDNVGEWTKNHDYYIDFISLPQEEDMNYLESYLIRKYNPKLNIMLSGNDRQAPFEIMIPDKNWVKVDEYMHQKEVAKNAQANTIANNILAVQQSNIMFWNAVKSLSCQMKIEDKRFVLANFYENSPVAKYITCSTLAICNAFHIKKSEIDENLNRIINYNRDARIEGTINIVRPIGIYDSFSKINENQYVLFYNAYAKKILENL